MDPWSSGRYTKALPITPSDTAPVNAGKGTKGLFCLTDGNVDLLFQDNANEGASGMVTLPMTAGVIYPFSIRMVYTTSVGTVLGLE